MRHSLRATVGERAGLMAIFVGAGTCGLAGLAIGQMMFVSAEQVASASEVAVPVMLARVVLVLGAGLSAVLLGLGVTLVICGVKVRRRQRRAAIVGLCVTGATAVIFPFMTGAAALASPAAAGLVLGPMVLLGWLGVLLWQAVRFLPHDSTLPGIRKASVVPPTLIRFGPGDLPPPGHGPAT